MAFASSNLTNESRSFSIGPVKVQIKTYTAANGDTSGTATFDGLKEIYAVQTGMLVLTAATTFSGNVATLAFADPGAGGAFGVLVAYGK